MDIFWLQQEQHRIEHELDYLRLEYVRVSETFLNADSHADGLMVAQEMLYLAIREGIKTHWYEDTAMTGLAVQSLAKVREDAYRLCESLQFEKSDINDRIWQAEDALSNLSMTIERLEAEEAQMWKDDPVVPPRSKVSPVFSRGHWFSSERFACRHFKMNGRNGKKPILRKQHRETVRHMLQAAE